MTSVASSPMARPPAVLRIFVALLAVGAAAFNVALMLSDRAPGLTRRLFGGFAGRLSARIDSSARLGPIAESRSPGNDAIVHIGVWAVAMALVGWALWRWWGLAAGAVTVFAASVLVEFGQGRYSTTREVELSDVVANAVGVMLGGAIAGASYLVWSAGHALVRRIRRR